MKIWIIAIFCFSVVGFGAQESVESTGKTDHNKEEHERLCEVLKAAVGRWGISGDGLSDTLKKALGRTIFGNESGGDIAELRKTLPSFYDAVSDGSATRRTACGEHESGQSAPYDIVCLCTLGNNSWPLDDTQTATTLCGHDKNALGSKKGSKGWSEHGTGFDQIKATWEVVTKQCLQGDKKKGETLKEALEKFLDKLENKPYKDYNRYQLGEGNPPEWPACTGYPPLGVCVMYYNGTQKMDRRPWWTDLQNALPEEEKFQEEKRREEERRKQQEQSEGLEEPRAEPLTSGLPTTNQTQRSDTESSTAQFRMLNMTSGTLTSTPSSWLLSVAILI